MIKQIVEHIISECGESILFSPCQFRNAMNDLYPHRPDLLPLICAIEYQLPSQLQAIQNEPTYLTQIKTIQEDFAKQYPFSEDAVEDVFLALREHYPCTCSQQQEASVGNKLYTPFDWDSNDIVDLSLETQRLRRAALQDYRGNNLHITCNHCYICGNNNTIIGNHNVIEGCNNTLTGNHNIISGWNNRILGNHNKIYGTANTFMGNHNVAYGDNNNYN